MKRCATGRVRWDPRAEHVALALQKNTSRVKRQAAAVQKRLREDHYMEFGSNCRTEPKRPCETYAAGEYEIFVYACGLLRQFHAATTTIPLADAGRTSSHSRGDQFVPMRPNGRDEKNLSFLKLGKNAHLAMNRLPTRISPTFALPVQHEPKPISGGFCFLAGGAPTGFWEPGFFQNAIQHQYLKNHQFNLLV